MKKLFVLLVFLGALLALYASCVEPFRLRTVTVEVATPKWSYARPLRIALLSDMHMIWPWMTPSHLQDIVQATNALQPDVVLLLGDYVGTHPFGRQLDADAALAPLKTLRAACGVFAVLGNHDWHPAGDWPAALARIGFPVLQNQALRADCQGNPFWVAGLEELWWRHADINRTLMAVTDAAPVILMMHHPDSFPDVPERVALSVAGHTHGGQVQLPFYGPVSAVIPSRYGLRYVYGLVAENGKQLVVTSGLGMTGVPFRLLAVPEIMLVTLRQPRS